MVTPKGDDVCLPAEVDETAAAKAIEDQITAGVFRTTCISLYMYSLYICVLKLLRCQTASRLGTAEREEALLEKQQEMLDDHGHDGPHEHDSDIVALTGKASVQEC